MSTKFELLPPAALKERWPRFSTALARHELLFGVWDQVVLIAETNAASGQRLSIALRRCEALASVPPSERTALIHEALADRRSLVRSQSTFLTALLWGGVETLGETATIEVDRNAAIDLNLRPRFRNVSDDFISHVTDEDGELANDIARRLEARGRSCWIAPRNLVRSDRFNEDILNAIESCGEFILLLSAATFASEFVRSEVRYALNHGKRITVIRLAPRLKAERIDMRLTNSQNLTWHRRQERCFEELLARLA